MTSATSPTKNWTAELRKLDAERARREMLAREAAQAEASRLQAEQSRRLADRARNRLADFLRAAWPIVEPSAPLVWGWHLDAICDHLEAVTRGDIRNLIITVPPGCTKSIIVAVMWPAWAWATNPSLRWLFASNEGDLATRDSLACRYVVTSDWYKQHFPGLRLVGDQNVKTWYQTSARGHRQAVTVAAKVTGKKGDILVVDDPNDAQKVEGEADRKAVISWWKDAFFDRVNDFRTGRRVVIGQRTHRQDLIGFIKEAGGFEELCIPEEFEPPRRTFTSIGWTDPRQRDGELLRPDRFGPEQVTEAKKRLGTIGYNAKHQQRPESKEGYRFKADWLKRRWRIDPGSPDWIILEDDRGPYRFKLAGAPRFATADGAASAKTSADFTVVSVWVGTPRGDLLWMSCTRRQVEIPDQPKVLQEVYDRHRFKSIGIEAVAANRALFQFAQRLHLAALPMDPKGLDKLSHAQGGLILAEAGGLWLPDAKAAPDFPLDVVVSELLQFTGGPEDDHDDVIDTLSYAVDMRPKVMSSGSSRPGIWKPTGRG